MEYAGRALVVALLGLSSSSMRTCSPKLPCGEQLTLCAHSNECLACFDPLTPQFGAGSWDTCAALDAALDASFAPNCTTTLPQIKQLKVCLEDEWFSFLTLGAVQHMCSGIRSGDEQSVGSGSGSTAAGSSAAAAVAGSSAASNATGVH